jgi:hypothetical protein
MALNKYEALLGLVMFVMEFGRQQLLQVKYHPLAGGVPVMVMSFDRKIYFCIFPEPEVAPEQEVVPV